MKLKEFKNLILPCLILLLGSIGCNEDSSKISKIDNLKSFMSFNLRYDNPGDNENAWSNRKEDVVDLIKKYNPDFLGIQEGLHHQVIYIDNQIPSYKYIGVGRDDGKTKGEYTAIYYDSTKYSLVKEETFWLSENPDTISVGWDASMERICTYGIFSKNVSEDSVHIFNAHFDHIGPTARLNSAKLILKRIAQCNLAKDKIVLMGDLNADPESDPISAFSEIMDDCKAISKSKFEGSIGTFNNFDPNLNPERRIDYIFTKNLSINSYSHINDKRPNGLCVSDHLPVFAEVE